MKRRVRGGVPEFAGIKPIGVRIDVVAGFDSAFRVAAKRMIDAEGVDRRAAQQPFGIILIHREIPKVAHGDSPGAFQRGRARLGGGEHGAVEPAGIVIDVLSVGQPDLLQVVEAGGGLAFFTRLGECGKQHGCENRDNRNHHKQFNQSKATFSHCIQLLGLFDNAMLIQKKSQRNSPLLFLLYRTWHEMSIAHLKKRKIFCKENGKASAPPRKSRLYP